MRGQSYALITVRRAAVAVVVLLLLFAFLLTRVFVIQFFDFERYQQKEKIKF